MKTIVGSITSITASEIFKIMKPFGLASLILLFWGATMYPQKSCDYPEIKAFDFQIGVWESADGKQVHEITKILSGCAVREVWKTDGRESAVALKSFDKGLHDKTGEIRWFYSWTAPGFHQFWQGHNEQGIWRFYREWWLNGEKILSRTYWTPINENRLERIVEQSRDDGKTWKPHVKNLFSRRL